VIEISALIFEGCGRGFCVDSRGCDTEVCMQGREQVPVHFSTVIS